MCCYHAVACCRSVCLAVAALVRDKKTMQIPNVMQTGKKDGMQLMEESVQRLFAEGRIDDAAAAPFGITGRRERVLPNGSIA